MKSLAMISVALLSTLCACTKRDQEQVQGPRMEAPTALVALSTLAGEESAAEVPTAPKQATRTQRARRGMDALQPITDPNILRGGIHR